VTNWLRRAGRGRLADGATMFWSVAEGNRGRRWRVQRLDGDELAATLLLEVEPDGRPRRFELAGPAGLLTLHPEPDFAAAHGNVVGRDGVRPLAYPWTEANVFFVAGLPVGELVTARRLAARVGVGEEVAVTGLEVDPRTLTVRPLRRHFRRESSEAWSIDGSRRIEVAQDGTPLGLDDAASWPLEEE
jgi:hypothetical protein